MNDPSHAGFENIEPICAHGYLTKGTRIIHKRFGLGTIQGKKGSDVIRVSFDAHGEKMLFEKVFYDTGLIRLIKTKA